LVVVGTREDLREDLAFEIVERRAAFGQVERERTGCDRIDVARARERRKIVLVGWW
jgi:hypothetical protein